MTNITLPRLGMYRFDNIPRNRTYQVSVIHPQNEFMPQILMATEELFYNFNFFALP